MRKINIRISILFFWVKSATRFPYQQFPNTRSPRLCISRMLSRTFKLSPHSACPLFFTYTTKNGVPLQSSQSQVPSYGNLDVLLLPLYYLVPREIHKLQGTLLRISSQSFLGILLLNTSIDLRWAINSHYTVGIPLLG